MNRTIIVLLLIVALFASEAFAAKKKKDKNHGRKAYNNHSHPTKVHAKPHVDHEKQEVQEVEEKVNKKTYEKDHKYRGSHQKSGRKNGRKHLEETFPSHKRLLKTLQAIIAEDNSGNGFNNWACLVDRDGVVADVVFSGNNRGDQFPASRQISCQKANTANSFSLPKFALSSGNLYAATQPGGSLFGLQEGNPLNVEAAYRGPSQQYGKHDPWVGQKAGGTSVFGGGLALYNRRGKLIGGLGISGDSSYSDHIVAWKLRYALNLDNVPAGVAPVPGSLTNQTTDNLILDLIPSATGQLGSESGYGYPVPNAKISAVISNLTVDYPIGPHYK